MLCFEMRGHRGYNICPWLKTGKNEICGKSCREEYCKDHRNKIRNGSQIPRPCLKCGIGIRSQIQLCRGCGRETERQRLRPVPNAAPLMCRTKLNTVRLWSDFGATADSDGVLAPDLIREGHGKYFAMRKICDLNSLTLSK